jgi:death-on-curing protein
MTPPIFLDLEEVLEFHAGQLALYGGREGIRDQGLLESALAQPSSTMFGNYLHEDMPAMAAAYLFHIAENQPFIDGNKRTALMASSIRRSAKPKHRPFNIDVLQAHDEGL